MKDKNWDPLPVTKILKSIEQIFKHNDISYLTNDAYKFIMNMSGFIAHYNIHGFKDEYEDVSTFIHDLMICSDVVRPGREVDVTWFQNQYGLPYCQSKVDIYKGIKVLCEKYQDIIDRQCKLNNSSKELTFAQVLAERNGYKLVRS